jgi:hypothetical protein
VTSLESPATAPDLGNWVADWYRALDRHDPVESVLTNMVDDGLELRFPEGTFFDEEHQVTSVRAEPWRDGRTTAQVVVNWQAKVWDPPAARSAWLGFDAYQTWEVVRGPGDQPQVRTYIVDDLRPMPGSASL